MKHKEKRLGKKWTDLSDCGRLTRGLHVIGVPEKGEKGQKTFSDK